MNGCSCQVFKWDSRLGQVDQILSLGTPFVTWEDVKLRPAGFGISRVKQTREDSLASGNIECTLLDQFIEI
jgi:hypothetical protein